MADGNIVISPFDEANLKEADYAFTLGETLRTPGNGPIDIREESLDFGEFHIPKEGYVLEPGQFVVGVTAEKITLDMTVGCLLAARSDIAQAGVDPIQSSSWVAPGSDNYLVLEIKNNGSNPVRLFSAVKMVKGIFIPIT